jgi:putative tricarboxylic transport membrane protein
VLSFVGAYSMRNSVADVGIAAAFGVFGFILKRLDLPTVPLIMGMVLGFIMEQKLRTAMMRVASPLDFIDRPITMILAGLIGVLVAMQVWAAVKAFRR